MSLLNKDENKTFGAVFRTPVENSKGIPHILEHSVLCGSKKYPIKEPFVELMKGSLNTFLNAFTYPDRTCYPVASTNLQVRQHFASASRKDVLTFRQSILAFAQSVTFAQLLTFLQSNWKAAILWPENGASAQHGQSPWKLSLLGIYGM